MNKFTVLFVDDEPNVLASIGRMFRRSAYRVLTANDGPSALALMEKETVDILVSDHSMPGMTGAELCRRVMERFPLTARIMLTAHGNAAELLSAFHDGAVYRILDKPGDLKRLLQVVQLAADQLRLIRCFQSAVKDLARRGEKFTYLVDPTGGTVRLGFPGNGASLRPEQVELVMGCLVERASAESLPLTGAVMAREGERLSLGVEFDGGRRLTLEISLKVPGAGEDRDA